MNPAVCWLEEDEGVFSFSIAPCRFAELDDNGRREYWATIGLRHTPGVGARRLARLLKKFGSAYEACKQLAAWKEAGIPADCAKAYKNEEWRSRAKEEWDAAHSINAIILLWNCKSYPASLRRIPDPPVLLYCIGDLSLLAAPCVAVVGTRQPTSHSREVARTFAQSLAQCGISIVSGMASGIDREAHLAALKGSGRSIGVLGTGINIAYPRSNSDIYRQMAADGLLLSEFPPDTAPTAQNFPIRNRIISGLSLGVVVIEAATQSGSLITARLALEQDRDVFAVPGPALNAHSLGCQNLIRQGARAVFCVDDILEDLRDNLRPYAITTPHPESGKNPENSLQNIPTRKKQASMPKVAPDLAAAISAEKPVVSALLSDSDKIVACFHDAEILDFDTIASRSGLDPSALNAALLGMEIMGQIERMPGARIRLCPC